MVAVYHFLYKTETSLYFILAFIWPLHRYLVADFLLLLLLIYLKLTIKNLKALQLKNCAARGSVTKCKIMSEGHSSRRVSSSFVSDIINISTLPYIIVDSRSNFFFKELMLSCPIMRRFMLFILIFFGKDYGSFLCQYHLNL